MTRQGRYEAQVDVPLTVDGKRALFGTVTPCPTCGEPLMFSASVEDGWVPHARCERGCLDRRCCGSCRHWQPRCPRPAPVSDGYCGAITERDLIKGTRAPADLLEGALCTRVTFGCSLWEPGTLEGA